MKEEIDNLRDLFYLELDLGRELDQKEYKLFKEKGYKAVLNERNLYYEDLVNLREIIKLISYYFTKEESIYKDYLKTVNKDDVYFTLKNILEDLEEEDKNVIKERIQKNLEKNLEKVVTDSFKNFSPQKDKEYSSDVNIKEKANYIINSKDFVEIPQYLHNDIINYVYKNNDNISVITDGNKIKINVY